MSSKRRPSTSAFRSLVARSSAGCARFSAITPDAYWNISITAAPAPRAEGVSGAEWIVSVSRYSLRPSSSGMPSRSAIT